MLTTRRLMFLALGLASAAACNGSEDQRRAVTASSAPPMAPPPPPAPAPGRALPAVALVPPDTRCQAERVFFATDSAALTDESRDVLSGYARCLSGSSPQQPVIVRGRADPRGTEAYNQSLSEERAEAVAAYLQSQGVPVDRIRIRALGEEGMQEGMPELWPAQRRVTVTPTPLNGQPPTPASQIAVPTSSR